MEELNKELSALTINKEIEQDKPTGLTYHLFTNNHFNEKPHVENPKRLTSILKQLNDSQTMKECEILSEFPPIDFKHIEDIHGLKYTSYLQNLFKKEFKGTRFEDTDTYYNKNSLKAALLAAEATRICAEKICDN